MKKLYSKNITTIIISLIIIAFGCKKENAIQTSTGTGNGSVQGVITDLNNSPIINATVTGGTATATTDASGKFTLTKVQFNSDTVVIIVTKDGFFESAKSFVSGNHAVSNATIRLISKTISGTIAASVGGDITIPKGGSINFNPGFVNASNGNAYTGNVSVSAYHLDPSDPNFTAYASGDFKAAGANNPQGSLQSFGVVLVEMNDASGNKLQLAPGKTATVTLPTALQGKAPSAVPLWYFDAAKGAWKQDGIAEKTGSDYISTVSHFSSWNPGNVIDSGQYIRLTLNGTNYSWSPSDSDGVHADNMDFDGLTGITGGSAIYNYYFKGQIINNKTSSAGNYPFILKLLINGIFYSSDKTDNRNQAIVTEYGPVGSYIKGSASGWIGSFAYTCTYKLIRIQ
ncbi:MAG TPA: hypothetical protein VFU29_14760 [Chitinophagaceae bacterium]|nr:hypothetical protein [Chitinophagaceae bacterium]